MKPHRIPEAVRRLHQLIWRDSLGAADGEAWTAFPGKQEHRHPGGRPPAWKRDARARERTPPAGFRPRNRAAEAPVERLQHGFGARDPKGQGHAFADMVARENEVPGLKITPLSADAKAKMAAAAAAPRTALAKRPPPEAAAPRMAAATPPEAPPTFGNLSEGGTVTLDVNALGLMTQNAYMEVDSGFSPYRLQPLYQKQKTIYIYINI